MQMVSSYIAGSADLGNGVVLIHCIANLCQKLAAMSVKSTVPTAMVDDKIISIADMVTRLNDCTGLYC